jgi:hypothetical protein
MHLDPFQNQLSVVRILIPYLLKLHIVTDLINALPGNSSVNTVKLFSVDPTDAPTDWLDSDPVI